MTLVCCQIIIKFFKYNLQLLNLIHVGWQSIIIYRWVNQHCVIKLFFLFEPTIRYYLLSSFTFHSLNSPLPWNLQTHNCIVSKILIVIPLNHFSIIHFLRILLRSSLLSKMNLFLLLNFIFNLAVLPRCGTFRFFFFTKYFKIKLKSLNSQYIFIHCFIKSVDFLPKWIYSGLH